MTKEKDDLFSDDNKATANWFKFEKIGDTVKGTLVGSSIKPARDVFPEQTVWELKQEDGSITNVASGKTFVRNNMKRAKLGQIVGFKYESDYQTDANKAKGMAPAKTIAVFLGDMDETYDVMEGMGRVVAEGENAEIPVDEVPFK